MKIIFTASAFVLLGMLSLAETAFSQDTTLPKGNSHIFLFSGKEIRNAVLWKIDSLKVEYVKSGNLGDVNTADVQSIEAPEFLILFNEERKMVKRHCDLIIPYQGDSVWCFIQTVDEFRILYSEKGSERRKSIMKSAVREYMQWSEQKDKAEVAPVIHKIVTETDSAKSTHMPVSFTPENKTTDLITPKEKILSAKIDKEEYYEANEKKEVNNNLESYYYQSYQRGINDAAAMNQGRWGARAFFLGLIYGAPYVSVAAAHSTENHVVVPEGVDAKLYKTGYQNAATMKKTRMATRGAAAAKGVVTFVVLLIIVT